MVWWWIMSCACILTILTRFLFFQGYLKYVPIVGSVLSWFAPSTPTTPEGRTFNLSSGEHGMVMSRILNAGWQGRVGRLGDVADVGSGCGRVTCPLTHKTRYFETWHDFNTNTWSSFCIALVKAVFPSPVYPSHFLCQTHLPLICTYTHFHSLDYLYK